ncbi:TetR/AcrR family transcriptional regulator [Metabacillus malikii]|uniref:AcrR family transcriptional regulator n=1 Tax=Metabacillus malikii TaxID=1504265 RepID=A0ABT9ZEP0_9BACI|nr:TetR/AcrR family transcriptional regulator [Metabacillus malikii]MDQ0230702.1 AcrR family transcriptional regulator [Metabacillus malikii]
MKVDRRIKKTRDAITKAFIELMAEKDFEEITINQLSERANLNRGTIYLHYADKYDLLDKCIGEQFAELMKVCGSKEQEDVHFPTLESLIATSEYFEKHFLFYSSMLTNKGMPSFRERLHEVMVEGINEQVNLDDLNKGFNKEFLVQFMASAIVGTIEWWIKNEMPIPAKIMAQEIWELLERNQINKK